MSKAIRFDRLSCGLPVCLQSSIESRLLGVSVWIHAGSARDPAGKEGLAHLCEHLLLRPLLFDGSPAQRIQTETGTLVNAHTDPEWVVITVQAPVEQTRPLIHLLSALVRGSYLEVDGLEAERKVILRELRDEEAGSAQRLVKKFRESAFGDHPWVRPIGGTPTSLEALDSGDVQRYYDRFLNASNMLITVSGGSGAGDSTAVLDEVFLDLSKCGTDENRSRAAQPFSPPDYRTVRIRDETVDTASDYGVLAGFASVPRTSDHYWTALAFELLMSDGPGSLLTRWLRQERPWIRGALGMTEAFSNWGCQYFLVGVSPDRAEEAMSVLEERWRVLPEFITDEQVEALRKRLESRALSSLESLQDRMTLMRDVLVAAAGSTKPHEMSLESIVAHHSRKLSSSDLRSYVRQYAEWDCVSLVCS